MERIEEIVWRMIEELYPEWIKGELEKYRDFPEYEQYAAVIRNTFHYDIMRACAETDHSLDYTDLAKKINIMKLNRELKAETKKKKEKKK